MDNIDFNFDDFDVSDIDVSIDLDSINTDIDLDSIDFGIDLDNTSVDIGNVDV